MTASGAKLSVYGSVLNIPFNCICATTHITEHVLSSRKTGKRQFQDWLAGQLSENEREKRFIAARVMERYLEALPTGWRNRSATESAGVDWGTYRYGPALVESDPATYNPVHDPQACPHREDIREKNTDHGSEQNGCNDQPKQCVPKSAYLPAKMGIKIRAAHLVAFDIVDNHRDDRRPAGEKGRDDERWPENPHENAETMKQIDNMGKTDQTCLRRNRYNS
jgi:hypothetical protein